MRSSTCLSLSFPIIYFVFSDTYISPGTNLIHLNGRLFMPFMLWVVFWNFSQSIQVIEGTDAAAIKRDSGLCGFEQRRRKIGAGAQKERSGTRRKGKTDLILPAAGKHLLGLSTHQTCAVALCHLKHFFQLQLKSFLTIFFFPLSWETDR